MLRHRLMMTATVPVVAALLASCTSGSSHDNAKKHSGPAVVAPGRPGEKSRTLSAEEASKARQVNGPNAADISYLQDMIEHHQQALDMTALAAKFAKARKVRAIADRINDTQGPEIDSMKSWLSLHHKPLTASGGHHHLDMPGMATNAQLTALGKARGGAFDTMFLKLMITHHQGALTMAAEVLKKGNDSLVEEMASDVISLQTVEIDRMRAM